MNMDIDIDTQARPDVPPGTKWEERWEILKPTIEFWYLDKKLSMVKLAEHMKENYGFNAYPHQYKHYLNKWGFKKNLRGKEKARIAQAVDTRARLGHATVVEQNGRRVDLTRVRRHMKNTMREDAQALGLTMEAIQDLMAGTRLTFGGQFFLSPLTSLGGTHGTSPGHLANVSPFGTFSFRSPSTGPSPATRRTTQTVVPRVPSAMAVQRACTFMKGDLGEALKGLTISEGRLMSTWLSQFQMFGFKVAKQWGYQSRPPGQDFGLHELDKLGNAQSPINSQSMVRSPHGWPSGSSSGDRPRAGPRRLCGWTIHVREIDIMEEDAARNETPGQPGILAPPIQETLRGALEHNKFTTIEPNTLPVAIPFVVKCAERLPDELLLESCGLAIMSRNLDLLQTLIYEVRATGVDVRQIHPIHLAIDYLDGSKCCCKIIEFCLDATGSYRSYDGLRHSERGYSMVDHLMMSILKSHTDLTPQAIDESNKADRFRGDEVSICGRWDADSKCIHELHSSSARVPLSWKHKFCHTSIQAVCHSMKLLSRRFPTYPSDSSGLFVKRCTNCGLKLELSQLHTLVAVTFLLADRGNEDEDLFGMIACLLCLFANQTDPDLFRSPIRKAHVSLPLLLDRDTDIDPDACTHQELSPADFARSFKPHHRSSSWSKKCETGWELFQILLDRIQKATDFLFDQVEEERDDEAEAERETLLDQALCPYHGLITPLSFDRSLAVAWAAIQTELLTYRVLNVGDPWLSDNFDMAQLLHSLKIGENLSIGLVHKGLMKASNCTCGDFEIGVVAIARAEHACAEDFSNFHTVTDPERTNYVLDNV